VAGLDFDDATVASLQQAKAPILEPGLNELLAEGMASGRLRFTSDPREGCAGAELLWVCYDTPVNDRDESDTAFVFERLRRALVHLRPGTLVLLSSQLPVGSCRELELEFPQFPFACSPENLRLGRALDAFSKAERVIVGMRGDAGQALLQTLFAPFTPQVLFMRTESAEMVKHALNSFLAVSITFINEVARLCELTGADAREVAAGLKSDVRIGPRAYLGPGGAFAGGTLARDVVTLLQLARRHGESISLLPAIKQSNDLHRGWALRKLQARLGSLRGKNIAVLGLVYTPNTDTLRRSAAVELCQQLLEQGAQVQAYDPALARSQPELGATSLAADLGQALRHADAAVVCTEWPQFRQADWPDLVLTMRQRILVDPNRFLEKELKAVPEVEHLSVGRP
jgi:UDPglucose 6-dehydrogenase